MNIHYYYLVLREEEKSAKLWFGTRYGAFEEINEGVPPKIEITLQMTWFTAILKYQDSWY